MGRKLLLIVSLLMMCMVGHTQDVRDGSNMTIGKIESDGKMRDQTNVMIGKVDKDGEVKDKSNMQIGRVKSDGTVVNRNNMTIGRAKNIPATYAAVFFFFELFE